MIEQGEFDAKNEIEINERGFLPLFALRFFGVYSFSLTFYSLAAN